MRKIHSVLLVLAITLLGARCSGKSGQEIQNKETQYKEIPVSQANEVLRQTATELGLSSELTEISADNDYFPAQLIYNGFRTFSIHRVRVVEQSERKKFAGMYGLQSFDIKTFIGDLCKKKDDNDASTRVFEMYGYDACYYAGETNTGPYEGTIMLVDNFILVSDTPPHPQEYQFNEELNGYFLVPIADWQWDNSAVTQTLINNFLEKY